jgi:hypothetical protein
LAEDTREFVGRTKFPKGEFANPMSESDLERKDISLSTAALSRRKANKILGKMWFR